MCLSSLRDKMSAAGRETANESSSVKAALDWSTVAIDNAVSSVSIRANLGACTRSTRSALNQHSISTQSALKQHSISTQTTLNRHSNSTQSALHRLPSCIRRLPTRTAQGERSATLASARAVRVGHHPLEQLVTGQTHCHAATAADLCKRVSDRVTAGE